MWVHQHILWIRLHRRVGLSGAGTPGEIRSLSVTLFALKDAEQVHVNMSDLVSEVGSIPKTAVDIRYIKWWYQGGKHLNEISKRVYKPELLLKDSELVRVDKENRNNYVRSTEINGSTTYLLASGKTSKNLKNLRPLDAKKLQPIDMTKGSRQEYWINIHIPNGVKPGTYQGTIMVTADQEDVQQIPVSLTVYPFSLEPSPLIYSLYYTSKIHKTKVSNGAKWDYWKSKEQYSAEILNMKEHGVLYPLNYQAYGVEAKDMLTIRKKAGLPTSMFFNHDRYIGKAKKPKQLKRLKEKTKRWIKLLREYGYKDIYFYGIDEARGEVLSSQREAWKAVHEVGGKVFVATFSKSIDDNDKTGWIAAGCSCTTWQNQRNICNKMACAGF